MPVPVKYINSYDNLIEISDDDEFLIVHNNKVYNVSWSDLINSLKESGLDSGGSSIKIYRENPESMGENDVWYQDY